MTATTTTGRSALKLTAPERQLVTALLRISNSIGVTLKEHGYHYSSFCDFALEEGRWYEPAPLPDGVHPGAPKACFGNAIWNAAAYGYRYIEGFATTQRRPGMPIHHAWNADDAGHVIDTTWVRDYGIQAGWAYLGVEFSVERADDCTWNGDASVLDDYLRRWPLLREKWHGEPADKTWAHSPRLDAIRDRDVAAAGRLLARYRMNREERTQ